MSRDRAVEARLEVIRVSDAMHRGVVTCSASATCSAVARTMAAHRIHAVVVTGASAVPGIVTDTDLLDALYRGTFELGVAADVAREAVLLRLSDSLVDAIERMHERRTTHAVVVALPLRPIGVVSVLDLASALAERQ